MSKDKQILLALLINIASAANWYGSFLNLLFGLHVTMVIYLIREYFKISITMNLNLNG